jgi:hypothetical protein
MKNTTTPPPHTKRKPTQFVAVRMPIQMHSKLMGKAIESNQTFTQTLLNSINLKNL